MILAALSVIVFLTLALVASTILVMRDAALEGRARRQVRSHPRPGTTPAAGGTGSDRVDHLIPG